MCYQDSQGHDPREPVLRGDDSQPQSTTTRIDPVVEIANLRHSLNQLEAYLFPHHRSQGVEFALNARRERDSSLVLKQEASDVEMTATDKVVGEVVPPAQPAPGTQVQGGLYVGPTTQPSLLLNDPTVPDPSSSSSNSASRHPSPSSSIHVQNQSGYFVTAPPYNEANQPSATMDYDQDLFELLPPLQTINVLVAHYFSYCNWVYRHVNQTAFLAAWERLRMGKAGDDHRMTLSTLAAILAVAMNYLPECADWTVGLANEEAHGWESLVGIAFDDAPENVGLRYFDLSTTALERHRRWLAGKVDVRGRGYTLELIELLLIRCHFRTIAKKENEEVWASRGELVTIAMAMGLHRDPGKGRMPSIRELEKRSDKDREREKLKMEREREVAERRRWAWWHIILLERWQAFMFGRPLAIASHHFDTQLPSYCPPSLDPTGRLYEPNLALFRLAYILGDIMDSAVSVRPEPYGNILQLDRMLVNWFEKLPPELDLDEYRITKNLSSTDTATRRLGIQSVVVRTSYHHIRFTLHRPYATNPSPGARNPSGRYPFNQQSLETAVSAASDLLTLVAQSRIGHQKRSSTMAGMLSSRTPAPPSFPGHLNWAALHAYASAMFFSFQLISNPTQPGAVLFRSNVHRALEILNELRQTSELAEQACDLLGALDPLSGGEGEKGEKEKVRILGLVRKLAFPYHSDDTRRRSAIGESPRSVGSASAGVNSSMSPQQMAASSYESSPPVRTSGGYATSSLRTGTSVSDVTATTQMQANSRGGGPVPLAPSSHLNHSVSPQQSQMYSLPPAQNLQPTTTSPTVAYSYPPPPPRTSGQYYPTYNNNMQGGAGYGATDEGLWGAAVGFEASEWSHFMQGFRHGPGHTG